MQKYLLRDYTHYSSWHFKVVFRKLRGPFATELFSPDYLPTFSSILKFFRWLLLLYTVRSPNVVSIRKYFLSVYQIKYDFLKINSMAFPVLRELFYLKNNYHYNFPVLKLHSFSFFEKYFYDAKSFTTLLEIFVHVFVIKLHLENQFRSLTGNKDVDTEIFIYIDICNM
jgi:hypothetical protein